MARRARSADRGGGDDTAGMLGRLTDVLERVLTAVPPQPQAPAPVPVPQRDPFKAPQFDGTGDVNYFIRQFEEVANANGWGAGAGIIHLRAALRDSARDCGQAETIAGILAALRARFGITIREAKARLVSLRRDYKTTLQAHAAEVERLVNIAYADLPRQHRERMVMDTFHSTLNHGYLQRHLLAIETPTLEDAVRAGNEYLQIKTTSGTNIRKIEGEEDEPEEESQVKPVTTSAMSTLLQAVQKLTEEVQKLKEKPADKADRKALRCYGCKKEGHIRKDCQTHPWPKKSGNEEGPQQ